MQSMPNEYWWNSLYSRLAWASDGGDIVAPDEGHFVGSQAKLLMLQASQC
jgi:hypothetical protein